LTEASFYSKLKENTVMKIRNILMILSFGVLLTAVATLIFFNETKGVESEQRSASSKPMISEKIIVPETKKIVEEEPVQTRVRFYGDLMIDRSVAVKMGSRGLDYIFEKVSSTKDFFGGTDILVANLEGPFAEKRISTSKSIAFRFDPKFAVELKKYGFTAFNLANNHSYDMGSKNVVFTRDLLTKNNLGWFGDELNEGQAYTFQTTTTAGIKIAFLGLHNTYHKLDLKKVSEALAAAKSSADYVIVNVHWGEEYWTNSNAKQQNLAHWLIDNGADAIIGHHPHVIQEIEIYKDRPIFYSLGNFIFDQYFSVPTQNGLGVTLVLSEGKIKQAEVVPFVGVNSQLNPMSDQEKNKLEDWLNKNSRLGERKIVDWKIIF